MATQRQAKVGVQLGPTRVDDGAIGAVDELRGADRLGDGADHPRAVGGGVVEDERIRVGRGDAAAGGVALELQRRAAGEHREETRRRGWARRPAWRKANQAACIWAT